MIAHWTVGLLALLDAVAAYPKVASRESTTSTSPKCVDFIIPVAASAPVKLIDPASVPVNLDSPTVLVDFIVSEASSGLAALLALAGTTTSSGNFNMSARYCEPAVYVEGRQDTIQYLQHAITMDKNYWSGLTYPVGFNGAEYSWIDYASKEGYPTISVDNLGHGNSSKPDPIAVVQMSLQVEIIHQIISKLRAGTVKGPLTGRSFDKVIYAGHSYGSICGNALATSYPTDVDTYILTGYSGQFIEGLVPLASGLAVPAALAKPRFEGMDVGYLAQSYEPGRVYGLYTVDGVGGFDPAVAEDDFTNEDTVSVGELGTLFYGVGPADAYTGNVYVITGKEDAIVCNQIGGADCGEGATSEPALAGGFFPNAADYSYIIPNATGHNVNLHYSAQSSFKSAHNYLASKGY